MIGGGLQLSPKATNSIAGGNATGFERHLFPTLKGSNSTQYSTLSGRTFVRVRSGGVATGY